MFEESDLDLTNNCSESINSQLNRGAHNGFKSYHSILETLTCFKKTVYENKTLSQLNQNKLRPRSPTLVHKYRCIEQYLIEYDQFSVQDKELYLIPFLKAINGIKPMVDPLPLNSYLH